MMSGKTKRVANRAAQALRLAAAALRSSQTALGAYLRRRCARMDKAKAVTAAAHKLARLTTRCSLRVRNIPVKVRTITRNATVMTTQPKNRNRRAWYTHARFLAFLLQMNIHKHVLKNTAQRIKPHWLGWCLLALIRG